MDRIKTFEEIDAWGNARDLADRIYILSGKGSFAGDFGLKKQIRGAAVSIMSNIAEGFESNSLRTFMRYLNIAKGSAGEVRSHLYIALDQSYISKTEFITLCDLSRKISSQLANFQKHLKNKISVNP